MSDQADQMAPDASPGAVSKKSGVRRVNNMPMYILAAALGAFLLVMMLVAADRAAKQNAPAQGAAEKAGNTSMFAKEIVGDRDGGTVEAASPLKPPELATGPESAPVLVARPDLDAPPPPPSGNLGQPVHDDEADRIRMAKLQMFQEAVKAKTGVRVDAPRSSGSSGCAAGHAADARRNAVPPGGGAQQIERAAQASDPTAAYQARLAQLRASGVGGQQAGGGMGGGAPQLLQTAGGGQGKNYAQFAGSGQGDRWRLDSQPEAPRSPFELRAGFVVPATLISGINSDLPGQIMAQVAQNVYDTPTGKHLLIPQGSRLVGSYSSDVAYGQSRVLVAWQRIVFPDGKAMDIGTMPGADSAGYAGFNDQVNNHYLRVFGSAFLMSGVVAGVSMSQDRGNSGHQGNQQRASDALSEALGQVLGNTIAQLISKNLNIAPTLEIRPGYRFNVIVTKDMTFSKPYQSFDY
jgi:type IV secretory pathway VirB10-like protein